MGGQPVSLLRAPLKIYSCPYAPIFHSNFLPKLLVIRQYDFVILTIICYKISAPLNNPIFLEVPIKSHKLRIPTDAELVLVYAKK